MNEHDKQIKQRLRDVARYFDDAAKRWPNYPDIARANMRGGLHVARLVALDVDVDVDVVNVERIVADSIDGANDEN